MAEYYVYPLYGVGCLSSLMGHRYIIGMPRTINKIRHFRDDLRFIKLSLLIVDWKSRRYKTYVNGYQSKWIRFKISEWLDRFQFLCPCGDWELKSKGAISDAHNYQNVIDLNTFNIKKYCKGE